MQPIYALLAGLHLLAATAYEENQFGWTHVFQAGRDVTNGSEVDHLETHEGKLYAGVGYWMAPFHSLQIAALKSPDAKWYVSGQPSWWSTRPEAMRSLTWQTDAKGKKLPFPVSKLVATWYLDRLGVGECGMGVLHTDAPTDRWTSGAYYRKRPYKRNYFTARAIIMHTDAITGIQYLFATTGIDGIIKGHYDPNSPILANFDKHPESGKFPCRPLALTVCGGKLYASGASEIKMRHDGRKATWSTIFDMKDHDDQTIDEAVGGIRGLSTIPNPSGVGESLYFGWCANVKNKGCMVRIDIDGNKYKHHYEKCVTDEMQKVLGNKGYNLQFAIVNYNYPLPVKTDEGKLIHIMGFEVLVFYFWHVDLPVVQETDIRDGWKNAFYAGAGFLIRRSADDYEARIPGGPRFCKDQVNQYNPPLVSVRALVASPFGDNGIYMGGYDPNWHKSQNTAWAMRGSADAVYAKPIDYDMYRECTSTTTTTRTCTFTTTRRKRYACDLCAQRAKKDKAIDMSTVQDQGSNGSLVTLKNIFDGKKNTWGGAENLMLDLGTPYHLSVIHMVLRNCECNRAGAFKVHYSMDNKVWKEEELARLNVRNGRLFKDFKVDINAQYLLFKIEKPRWRPKQPRLELYAFGLVGYPDYGTPAQVLVPHNNAGHNGRKSYNCEEAEAFANGAASRSYSCEQFQDFWAKKCCEPERELYPLPDDCAPGAGYPAKWTEPTTLAPTTTTTTTTEKRELEGFVDFATKGFDEKARDGFKKVRWGVALWLSTFLKIGNYNVNIPSVEFAEGNIVRAAFKIGCGYGPAAPVNVRKYAKLLIAWNHRASSASLEKMLQKFKVRLASLSIERISVDGLPKRAVRPQNKAAEIVVESRQSAVAGAAVALMAAVFLLSATLATLLYKRRQRHLLRGEDFGREVGREMTVELTEEFSNEE